MTYSTGQPIMFVGVGQTCKLPSALCFEALTGRVDVADKDLRRMNVKMLIKALLK